MSDEIVYMPLTKSECLRWIEDLRSGNFIQGSDHLSDPEGFLEDRQPVHTHCCLGVLGERTVKELDLKHKRGDEYLNVDENCYPQFSFFQENSDDPEPGETIWIKLPSKTQKKLGDMNDNGTSFEDIADFIENTILPNCPE